MFLYLCPVKNHLSSGSSHHQLVAVFAQTDLLDAQSGVIAVRVETAHLHTNTRFKVLYYHVNNNYRKAVVDDDNLGS